jgi:hypothetical protein
LSASIGPECIFLLGSESQKQQNRELPLQKTPSQITFRKRLENEENEANEWKRKPARDIENERGKCGAIDREANSANARDDPISIPF